MSGSSGNRRPEKPTPARITIWVVVGAIGVYLIVSGIVGMLSGGN